eukprot:gene16088-biopygen17138
MGATIGADGPATSVVDREQEDALFTPPGGAAAP